MIRYTQYYTQYKFLNVHSLIMTNYIKLNGGIRHHTLVSHTVLCQRSQPLPWNSGSLEFFLVLTWDWLIAPKYCFNINSTKPYLAHCVTSCRFKKWSETSVVVQNFHSDMPARCTSYFFHPFALSRSVNACLVFCGSFLFTHICVYVCVAADLMYPISMVILWFDVSTVVVRKKLQLLAHSCVCVCLHCAPCG